MRSVALTVAFGALAACSMPTATRAPSGVPTWVFPLATATPASATPAAAEATQPVRLPGSAAAFTRAQLSNRFGAPDWYPSSHGPMPEVVARGRPPDLYACGYCHTPGGQGRPENAPLAGLPSEYIVQQVMDFKSGARRALLPGVFAPADAMIHLAMLTTPAEARSAGEYFSKEKLRPRVVVVERSRVPRTRV